MATWSTIMTPLLDWPAASHARAVDNARGAAVACSRAGLEREKLTAYLLEHARGPVATQTQAEARIAHGP